MKPIIVKPQDKQTEMIVGSWTPDNEWLDDTQGYRVRKAHLQLLGLSSLHGQKILDAGCGPGTYGIMLAQAGNEVVGIEISPGGVQVADRRAKEKTKLMRLGHSATIMARKYSRIDKDIEYVEGIIVVRSLA